VRYVELRGFAAKIFHSVENDREKLGLFLRGLFFPRKRVSVLPHWLTRMACPASLSALGAGVGASRDNALDRDRVNSLKRWAN
jgi:hypothetical protein